MAVDQDMCKMIKKSRCACVVCVACAMHKRCHSVRCTSTATVWQSAMHCVCVAVCDALCVCGVCGIKKAPLGYAATEAAVGTRCVWPSLAT
jgi:hypothetical protein